MAKKPRRKTTEERAVPLDSSIEIEWQKAEYKFHTFSYRDPRAAFASAPGLPVVSPTAVLFGIASTLFKIGKSDEARSFLRVAHLCRVVVDPPKGAIFFRAFHQLRRYETDKYDKANARLGLTQINQGTREYSLVDGSMSIYVGAPRDQIESVRLALFNREHLGTHDSICSISGEVTACSEPEDVVYMAPEQWQAKLPDVSGVSVVTLSRFKSPVTPAVPHWYMSGGEETELIPYLIKGTFRGTSRGKVYRKH
jgi:CRISPR-associated Cas5-like protein